MGKSSKSGVNRSTGSAYQEITTENYEEVGSTAALKLSSLWKLSRHAQLLQHPPLPPGPKHADLIQQSNAHVAALEQSIGMCPDQPMMRDSFLTEVLAYKPTATLSKLAAWLQQKPELLDIATLAAADDFYSLPNTSYGKLWLCCLAVIADLCYTSSRCLELGSGHDGAIAGDLGEDFVMAIPSCLDDLMRNVVKAGRHVGSLPVAVILKMLSQLLHVHPGLATAAPLIIQVQRCAILLKLPAPNAGPGSAAARSSSSSSSNRSSSAAGGTVAASSSSGGSSSTSATSTTSSSKIREHGTAWWTAEVYSCIVRVQILILHIAGGIDPTAHGNNPSMRAKLMQQLAALWASPATAEAVLQLLTVRCYLLHHDQQQKQQQQQQQLAAAKHALQLVGRQQQLLHPELLDIPALHQQVKLIPHEAYLLEAKVQLAHPAVLDRYLCISRPWLSALQHHADTLDPALVGATAAAAAARNSSFLTPTAIMAVLELLLLLAGQEARHKLGLEQQQQRLLPAGQEPAAADAQQQLLLCDAIGNAVDRCAAVIRRQFELLAVLKDVPGLQQHRKTVLGTAGLQLLQGMIYLVQRQGLAAKPATAAAAAAAGPAASSAAQVDGQPEGAAGDEDSSSQAPEVLLLLGAVLEMCCVDIDGPAPAAASPPLSVLAAAHPVEYFTLVDCCCRSKLEPLDIMLPMYLLKIGASQPKEHITQLLSNTAATAALASALTSMVKHWAVVIRTPLPAATSDRLARNARSHVVAALPQLLRLLPSLYETIYQVEGEATATSTATSTAASSSSSSNGQQQVLASSILLYTLILRSLAVLGDALQARATLDTPVSLVAFQAVQAQPVFVAPDYRRDTFICPDIDGHTEPFEVGGARLWQLFQAAFLRPFMMVWGSLMLLLPGQPQSAAIAAALDALDADCSSSNSSSLLQPAAGCSSSSSSSSSSSAGRVRWSYLLQLHESRKLRAAAAAFNSKYVFGGATAEVESILYSIEAAPNGQASTYKAAQDTQACVDEQYNSLLHVSGVLAALAPLPLICNNQSCVCLDGISEAAAACKECAGCGARYCCAACQVQHWRQHKKACRRIAAAGLSVNHCLRQGQH